jgi:hypothetical protein
MQMNAADSPQNVSSVIAELEGIGGGVFLTRRGVESRIAVPELWRAFEQPVLVWVHGEQFDDSGVEGLVAIAKRFPHLRRFRLTSTRVTADGVRRLREFWPDIPIDGLVC